jgi:hypothetical protein
MLRVLSRHTVVFILDGMRAARAEKGGAFKAGISKKIHRFALFALPTCGKLVLVCAGANNRVDVTAHLCSFCRDGCRG